MSVTKQFLTLKLSEIKPYPNNPRINDEAVADVVASIEQCENLDPIEVDENNVILSGHTRLKALKRLKYKETDVIKITGLNEQQKRKYRLLANKTGEHALWDNEKLDFELEGLDFGGYDFGFELDFSESDTAGDGEVVEDDFDTEPPEEPKSKLGDIYQLGEHRLMCGDSTKSADFAVLMGDDRADMVFTDPPYNVDYADKNEFLNAADKGNCIQTDIENDAFADDESAMNNLWLPAFTNMREVADDYCSIYVTMPQGGAHMMMMMSIKNAGWQVKHELIWVKNNHVLGRTDYYYKHEPILYGWNKKHNFYGKGEFDKSVWEIPKPNKSDLHPTMKPIPLVVNAILNSSQAGDIVVDAFGGSGTTLIACEQTGRKARLMEFDPKYVDVIIERWENFTGKKAVKIN